MSSIPTSAMPRAVEQTTHENSTDERPVGGRGALARVMRIATAPAIVTLGLTAMAISAVTEVLAAKGSPVTVPEDQVPI
jgi:hypothetical protein